MTIVSGLVRADRFAEVEGCPLAAASAAEVDEAACATCPYNALKPGAARIGCVLHTPWRGYQKLLDHVERVAGAETRARLEDTLEAQTAEGLPRERLVELASLGERLWDLCGNDAELRDAVSCLWLFSGAAVALGEPAQLFSSFNIGGR